MATPSATSYQPHILSDLHTEFADFELPETDADVIVLAGDIGAPVPI